MKLLIILLFLSWLTDNQIFTVVIYSVKVEDIYKKIYMYKCPTMSARKTRLLYAPITTVSHWTAHLGLFKIYF